jgi:2-methylcitrate dehydratase PrpD
MNSLSAELARILGRPVDEAARGRAARHVLDWVGCAASGALTAPGRAMLAYGRTLPAGAVRMIGGPELSAGDAALVGGAFGNVLEMDDFYRTALVHPGPVVVPAALALAAEIGAGGAATLAAIVRGFETMIRIGRSVGPAHYRHFHNTATCGAFGAAAAAASLLGLDESRTADALGHAGTLAAGLWQCRLEDTMSKQLHNGHAARTGLVSARLASHGLTGARQILEGPLGFFAALCPDATPTGVTSGPEAPWLIHGCSFKPWPACRHTHPTIDAALALRGRLDPGRITVVTVETFRDAVLICDRPSPATVVEARFSLQHAVAATLVLGRPALAHFEMDMVGREDVAALRERVVVAEGERFSRQYPAHFGAAVGITLEDGGKLCGEVADAFGDPEHAMSEADITGKARMLLEAAGYTAHESDRVIEAASALAGGGTARDLLRVVH